MGGDHGGEPVGPLAGLRVLDLTGGVAGPVAGMLLADLDADVVKVYPPGGSPSPAVPGLYVWDRNKVGGVFDPTRHGDGVALDHLVETADIVLVGTGGGAVDHGTLVARGSEPGRSTIWVVMPPYLLGQSPWVGGRESAGLLYAWLGHAWSQASYNDVPVDCVYPLSLYMQGIWAATAAVALHLGSRRGRSTASQVVVGGAHGAMLVSPGSFVVGRDDPHVHRPGGPGGALPNYRCYRCSDGGWLFLGAFTTAFIERGLRAIGAAGVLDDPRIDHDAGKVRWPEHFGWIATELESVFASRSCAEWVERLEAADVPVAVVGDSADWLDHDQVMAMGLRVVMPGDTGQDLVMPGLFVDLSATPGSVRRSAPTRPEPLGELVDRWSHRPTEEPTSVGRRSPPDCPSDLPARPTQLPLAGMRVLDLGTIIAGPYAATLLGELGADVVKVERPPNGDEYRVAHGGRGGAGFSVYNREQRSVLLDIADERGRDVLMTLVGSSDVVVDNYRPGVLERLGIDHGHLAAVNPLIVSLSISAFGGKGALGTRPGFDPVVQAMSGIMRSQGGPDSADSPAFLTVPINDVVAAGLGVLGACASLLARTRLERGQHVDVTLCAASCLVQSEHLVRVPGRTVDPLGGRDFAGPDPLEHLYQVADGWVRLAGRWQRDRVALERAGLPTGGSSALAGALSGLRVEAVVRRLTAVGIPALPARQSRQLVEDTQLIESGLLSIIEGGSEESVRVGPGRWLVLPGRSVPPPGDAPLPGAHSGVVLSEVGIGADHLSALAADGVVQGDVSTP